MKRKKRGRPLPFTLDRPERDPDEMQGRNEEISSLYHVQNPVGRVCSTIRSTVLYGDAKEGRSATVNPEEHRTDMKYRR